MNPNGKVSELILFLYSIEPPFYSVLNEACRKRNITLLNMFGPFAFAIWFVLRGAENNRRDRLKDSGFSYTLGWFTASFLVFRGVEMELSWIIKWQEVVGKTDENDMPFFINIPGNTSTSQSLRVSLGFGK